MEIVKKQRRAFLIGAWPNFDEMENSLTLDELDAIIVGMNEQEADRQRFLAAVNGLDLEEDRDESLPSADEVRARVAARLAGKSEEEIKAQTEVEELASMGIFREVTA